MVFCNLSSMCTMCPTILSIGKLLENGYIIHIEKLSLVLKDAEGRLVAKVQMGHNHMFPLHLNSTMEKCFHGLVKNESWKWHLRLGHLNFNGLKLLSTSSMVHRLPSIEKREYVCEICTLGKQQRSPFPSGRSWRAPKPLELVHTDICGPFDPISVGGNKYFISFYCDFSRKLWVYLIKEKFVAFTIFKSFKAHVEVESGFKIKIMRSTEVVSTPQMNFEIIAEKIASSNSLQLHTHHNKMALQRGKIEQSLI